MRSLSVPSPLPQFHTDPEFPADCASSRQVVPRAGRRPCLLRGIACAAATAAAVVLVSASLAGAAVFNIVNRDAAGEGLNDPTVVAPVGGNSGTTLGAQRLQALQYAAGLWGARLTSAVATDIDVAFDPIACGGTMGWSSWWDRDFANVVFDYTWYPMALANKLAGSDLCVANSDCGTGSEFDMFANSSLDDGSCPGEPAWYYGLDANPGANQRDLVTLALVVIAKNSGMESTIDLVTGALMDGFPDVLSQHLAHLGSGDRLASINFNTPRQQAVTDPGRLHWMGSGASPSYLLPSAAAGLVAGLGPWGTVEMYSPEPGVPGLSVSMFSPELDPDQLLEAPGIPPAGVARHDFGLADDALADLGWAVCGNDVAEMDEQCDENALCCSAGGCCGCRVVGADAVCGDGVLETNCNERCDDGNVVAGDGCDAACQIEDPAAACQKAIYDVGRKYLRKVLKAVQGCRNAINREKLTIAPAECPTHESVAPKLVTAAAKFHTVLSRKCTDALVASLNACAPSMAGLIAPAGDAGCIVDGCHEATQKEVGAAYGKVLDLTQNVLDSCQRAIGKASTKYLLEHLKFRYECRQTLNEGDFASCIPVLEAPDGNMSDTWWKFRRGVFKGDCSDVVVTSLETCNDLPGSVDGLIGTEAGCLSMVTSAVADDLIEDWTGQ